MSAPLENIKVLDLTHMLAGPYASMLIADLGAEVVKLNHQAKAKSLEASIKITLIIPLMV